MERIALLSNSQHAKFKSGFRATTSTHKVDAASVFSQPHALYSKFFYVTCITKVALENAVGPTGSIEFTAQLHMGSFREFESCHAIERDRSRIRIECDVPEIVEAEIERSVFGKWVIRRLL